MDGFLSIFRQKLHQQHVRACFKETYEIFWEGIEVGEIGGAKEDCSLHTHQESENALFCVDCDSFERW